MLVVVCEKISKLGWEKFVREYPLTLDEAYRISGNTYFTAQDFEHVNVIQVQPSEWTTFENPNPDDSYSVGVDVSGGVGRVKASGVPSVLVGCAYW